MTNEERVNFKKGMEFVRRRSEIVIRESRDYLKTFDKDASARVQKERFLELMKKCIEGVNVSEAMRDAKILLGKVDKCECHFEAVFLGMDGELWHLITMRDLARFLIPAVSTPAAFTGGRDVIKDVLNNKNYETFLGKIPYDQLTEDLGISPYSLVEQLAESHEKLSMTGVLSEATQPPAEA